MNLAEIRKNYMLYRLTKEDTGNDPIEFFKTWLLQAIDAQVPEPTAMALSTVDLTNRPKSRIVLLKGIDNGNFKFFTNYNSQKGKDIEHNPFGSLLFFWKELERQVRVEGMIEKLSPEESDEYFYSRPVESQIGAIVSQQSEVIANREYLDKQILSVSEQLDSYEKIKRPIQWGGYALIPDSMEFWQGRESRLHDRIRFRLRDGLWFKERLAP